MHLEPSRRGRPRGALDAVALAREARGIVLERALAIGARVQLDHLRPEPSRRFDRPGIRLDEERDADTRRLELIDIAPQLILAAHDVEATLGRALLALLRHEAAGMRHVAQR